MELIPQLFSEAFALERFTAPGLVFLGVLLAGAVWVEFEKRWNRGAQYRSSHELVNLGGETDRFFDSDRFVGHPRNVKRFGAWLSGALAVIEEDLRAPVDRLAFIEKTEGPVGALTLQGLASYMTGKPTVTVRLGAEIQSPVFQLKGSPVEEERSLRVLQRGERVVVVSDVVTSGETTRKASRIIESTGAEVVFALFIFDRQQEASFLRGVTLGDDPIRYESFLSHEELIGTQDAPTALPSEDSSARPLSAGSPS